ncbi:hypothetical protein PoB_006430900 [Plakobranchus ocellatus]|uniref:Uncharacterized protein n=1 Tax=Plakobranchus ocellatus TaxID=259542 RepID=A0AAV4D140_9GAST|nr:hypothetical protein PoB_006430900 [Plakobranchus ocellatus]
MADRNEDFVNVGDNESGEVVDSEERDREMEEVTFHDLQPVALIGQDEFDAESDTLGEEEANIEEYNLAPDVGHKKREQSGDLHLCPLAKLKKKKNIVKIPKNMILFTDS